MVSLEKASYLCAYKCGAFPKTSWHQIYYTAGRAREAAALRFIIRFSLELVRAMGVLKKVQLKL